MWTLNVLLYSHTDRMWFCSAYFFFISNYWISRKGWNLGHSYLFKLSPFSLLPLLLILCCLEFRFLFFLVNQQANSLVPSVETPAWTWWSTSSYLGVIYHHLKCFFITYCLLFNFWPLTFCNSIFATFLQNLENDAD